MTELGQLVDHAAELQRTVDRLWAELLALWLGLLALAIVVAVQGWRIWH